MGTTKQTKHEPKRSTDFFLNTLYMNLISVLVNFRARFSNLL